MPEQQHSGLGRRGWWVLVVAAAGGVIAGVALERSGTAVPIPSFVQPVGAHGQAPGADPAMARTPARESAPIAALAGLPTYPGATARSLGDGIVAGGVPMAVAFFSTPDPPQDVMAFYENALKETHDHVVKEWMTSTTGYVGYRDAKTDELHGVVIRREDGKTMVFPSTTAPGRIIGHTTKVPDYLPQPDDAEGTTIVSMGSQADGSRQSSVVTTVPLSTVRHLLAFYKKAYADKGWAVEGASMNTADFGRVTATRDDMRAETYLRHVTGDGRGPRVEIYVILTTRDHA